ncbi:MAG: hypothetical protein R3C05_18980 [Pirellulaceae bacterium]
MKQSGDKDVLERVQNLDVTKTNHEAELLFEELISKYPEVEFHGRRITDLAKPEYFAVSQLAIGKVAPEINGHDLDAEPLVLGEYAAKWSCSVFGELGVPLA